MLLRHIRNLFAYNKFDAQKLKTFLSGAWKGCSSVNAANADFTCEKGYPYVCYLGLCK